MNFTAESGGWSKPAGHPPNPDRARREAALKDDYLKMMKREIYKIYHKIYQARMFRDVGTLQTVELN